MDSVAQTQALRRAVRLIALLNTSYFAFEFGVAAAIGSVSPFAEASIQQLAPPAYVAGILQHLGRTVMAEGMKAKNCLARSLTPFASIIQHRRGPLRSFENNGAFFVAGFALNQA
jgi:hypothetical protein